MERAIRYVRLAVFTFLLAAGINVLMFSMAASADSSFKYKHDPCLDCKAMEDIVVNPDAVYGFSPSPNGDLKQYASYDWTDPDVVEKAKQSRIAYHEQFNTMFDKWEEMKNQGATDYEIAVVICNMRNQIRLDAYKDDPEGLEKCKQRNLEKYGDENGPSAEYIYVNYKKSSWLEVIYSAFAANSGMDACLGLYDDQYNHNLLTGSIGTHTLDQGVVTKKATATTAGILTRTCSVCGTKITETIPPLGKKEPSVAEKSRISLNSKLHVTLKKSKVTVKWGKVDGASSYQIYAAYCGTKTMKKIKTVKASSGTTFTFKKIGKKKWNCKGKLKVYVVALDKQNKVICKSISAHVAGLKNKTYTNAKTLKVSKSSYVLKTGKTAKVSCKTVRSSSAKKLISSIHVKRYRYATSNKYIATVSSNGVVKGVDSGSCYIYVYAQNGLSQKVKITIQ